MVSVEPVRPAPVIAEAPLIRDQVYEVLLDKLIGGELQPGDRITERVTAGELGVSTTPVKEALRRLENEGFVRTMPRRGIVVSDHALAAVEHAITVRAWLEGLAARLAATQFADDPRNAQASSAYRELSAALAAMKDPIRRSVDETVDINSRFHDAIRTLAGNRVITQFVGILLGVDAAIRRRALSDPDELQHGNREHIQIAEAVLAGKADQAEDLMREHVLRSGAHTLTAQPAAASRTAGPR